MEHINNAAEDYSTSRKLAEVEHLGLKFKIVRMRRNGKNVPHSLVLVHCGVFMATAPSENVPDCLTWAAEQFRTCFPGDVSDALAVKAFKDSVFTQMTRANPK